MAWFKSASELLCVLSLGMALIDSPLTARILFVSTAGNDDSGDGSWERPFQTIHHALSLAQSGDEVVLRGAPGVADNTYREAIRIRQPNLKLRSHNGEWAVIRCPTADRDVATCVLFDVDSDGSRLQRLEVIAGYYYGIKLETKWDWGDPNDRSGAQNIVLENLKVHDTGNAAIKVTPGCDGLIVRRVELYNTGRNFPNSAEGIDNVNGDRMLVQDSYIHDTSDTGIYCKGGAIDCVVERTLIAHTGGAGILLGFDTSPEFFDLTENPEFYENIRGVARNNIIVDTQGAGIGLFAAKDAQVWNNTLIDTAKSYHSPIYFGVTFQDWDPHAGRPPSTNSRLRNNLIFQSSGLPSECVVIRFSNELGGLSALSGMPNTDFNLYFHESGGCRFSDQRPTTFLDRGTFSQWQAASNAEQHSLTSDPILTLNGHLSRNSPAVDAGICEGGPRDDFNGQRRPQGASCDVGADERTPELRVLPYPFPPPDPTPKPIPESQ